MPKITKKQKNVRGKTRKLGKASFKEFSRALIENIERNVGIKTKPIKLRGKPYLSPVISRLKMLDRYYEAEKVFYEVFYKKAFKKFMKEHKKHAD